MAIAPLAGWKVESAHPEQVMQGLGSGLTAIAQGISAAYISRHQEDLKKDERKQEIQLKQQEMANQRTIAGMRAASTEASQAETQRHNLAMEELKQGIKDRGGNLGTFTNLHLKPFDKNTLTGSEEKSEGHITGGISPEYINQTKKEGLLPSTESNEDLDKSVQPKAGSILAPKNGNITMPPVPEPSLNYNENNLGSIKPPATEDYATTPVDVHSGKAQFASRIPEQQDAPNFKPVSAEDINYEKLGTLPVTLAQENTGSLSGTKPFAIPEYEQQINKNYKAIPDETAQQIYDYAKSRGYDTPVLTGVGDNGVGDNITEVKWPSPEQVEARKTREEAQKTREEAQAARHDIQTQNTLNRESMMFQNHPAVKAFTAPNGMQQSLPRFIKDYDAIVKNPESAGISDVGLLDMFARAEGGGRVTEGQANLALGSMSLKDKAMLLGYKLEGGDRLSQNQRDQMLRVIAEDHAVQVSLANQAVNMTRNKLKAQGVTDENSLPQPYIPAKTKWEALDEITQMKKNALAIHEQQKQAEANGDKKTANDLKRQLEDIGKSAVDLRKKIDSSKSAIINLDEIQNTPQGWGGSAAATLIQQP